MQQRSCPPRLLAAIILAIEEDVLGNHLRLYAATILSVENGPAHWVDATATDSSVEVDVTVADASAG